MEQTTDESHQRSTHHHVVEVSDHEVRIMQVHVCAERTEEQTGQSTDGEQEQEGNRIAHRRRQTDRAFVHGRQPVEHFDGRWNRHAKGQSTEDDRRQLRHTRGKHVVTPHDKPEQRNRHRAVCDEAITEDALVAVHADQFADDAETWQNHDVHAGWL